MTRSEPSAVEWIVTERDSACERRLCTELGITTLLAAALVQKGLQKADEAERYLHPQLEDLHDPSLLPDYGAAAKCILGAKERGERIYVHGDYDVDGVTSTAIFVRFLETIGCDVVAHVPHRMKEGYGIHLMAVDEARDCGASLFLTCDCGVGAHEQVEKAKEYGMTVVVTDHHLPGPELPRAEAVINPHRKDSVYPFEDLCGAGVVFKFCAGLTRELGHPVTGFYRAFLDLVALGTVADVMPLVGENRTLVRHGLPMVFASQKEGLKALMRHALREGAQSVSVRDVGFGLGPRLNAAGRLDDAAVSLQLLLTKDPKEAKKLAKHLDDLNSQRKTEQLRIVNLAVERVQAQIADLGPVVIVAGHEWHPGIIGLVAGKLVEAFQRPAFVISVDSESGIGKGSARSVPGFNLAAALHTLKDVLIAGGGHEMAAGFSIEQGQIGAFSKGMTEFAMGTIGLEPAVVPRQIDIEVTADEGDFAAVDQLALLEPIGESNPCPLLLTRQMRVEAIKPTRSPEHCGLTLRATSGAMRQAMGFGIGERLVKLEQGLLLDAVYRPVIDTFNGSRTLKWHIEEFAVVG